MRMTMPANVIYLPPGVMPPAQAGAAPGGIPFDRQFFERILPQAVKAYCEQSNCTSPQVQVATIDGTLHHIVGISGVTDSWVAVQASREDHPHVMELFLPYQTIYRVEIHPEGDEGHGHLGFVLPANGIAPAVQPEALPSPAAGKRSTKKSAPKK
jgi:hypothetical protein